MSRYAKLTDRAEAHLATAEAGADDPRVAALCALTAAVLAARPTLRPDIEIDPDDTSPEAVAARAVAAAFQAAAEPVDQIEFDDCGFPSPVSALSSSPPVHMEARSAAPLSDEPGRATGPPAIARSHGAGAGYSDADDHADRAWMGAGGPADLPRERAPAGRDRGVHGQRGGSARR